MGGKCLYKEQLEAQKDDGLGSRAKSQGLGLSARYQNP
jgi:hypothetical protein